LGCLLGYSVAVDRSNTMRRTTKVATRSSDRNAEAKDMVAAFVWPAARLLFRSADRVNDGPHDHCAASQ